MLIKVIHGSTFDTIGTLTKINAVQVHRKNLILGVLVFQLLGNKGFLYLSDNGALLGQESIFGQLLSNGATTLHLTTT